MPLPSQIFEPHPLLQHDIKCYWTMDAPVSVYNAIPVLPDTHVELIINCGAPFTPVGDIDNPDDLPCVFLNRLQNRPIYPKSTGDCQFIGVRLYAWAVRNLITLPKGANQADDRAPIVLDDSWQTFGKKLVRIVHQRGYAEAINQLQDFVLAQRQLQPRVTAIQSSGALLHESGGQIDMPTLAANSHLSLRQFERQFKYHTGILPKAYVRLLRYENARHALFRNPDQDMVALAQDLGYYDQAHFIHEFKAFTTRTPGDYVAGVRSYAAQ